MYVSPLVRKMVEMEENERSIEDYFYFINILNNMELMNELTRIQKYLEDEKYKNDMNMMIKKGITRYYCAYRNQGFVEGCFKNRDPTILDDSGRMIGEELFHEAKKIDPHHVIILYCSALFFLNRGDFEKFEAYYNLINTHHKDSQWTVLINGRRLMHLKTWKEMSKETGIHLSTPSCDNLKEMIEENLEEFERKLKGHVTHMFALKWIVGSFERFQREDYFEKYVHYYNENWGHINIYGYISLGYYYTRKMCKFGGHRRNNDLLIEYGRRAEKIYQKALQISTDSVYYYLSFLKYMKESDFDKCLELIEKEIETDPYSVKVRHFRTDIIIQKLKSTGGGKGATVDEITMKELIDQFLMDMQYILEIKNLDKEEEENDNIIKKEVESLESRKIKEMRDRFGREYLLRYKGYKRNRDDEKERIYFMETNYCDSRSNSSSSQNYILSQGSNIIITKKNKFKNKLNKIKVFCEGKELVLHYFDFLEKYQLIK